MRDIFVAVIIFGSLPFILARPYVGILMWSWIGYMNPHKLCWGFAMFFPFAQIVAITTLIAMFINKEERKFPWTRETIVLLLFVLWMCLTTAFALETEPALKQFDKVIKIQFMIFVTLMIMQTKERINLMVWVMALSIAFYGVKGGIFTINTGGAFHVRGPYKSFIGDNNTLGLAMLMVLPLLRYLQLQSQRLWVRHGLLVIMLLNLVAILGTQSRGALVGLIAVGVFLLLKSPKRISFLIPLVIVVPLALNFMPDAWWERMGTIQNYEEDRSAQGRFNSWHFAFNLAVDRPIGGGYQVFRQPWFRLYAPMPEEVHDAHSIYFEVLGEHGFVGLMLFLLLGLFSWRSGSWIIRNAKDVEDVKWAADLARMLQVSLVAYASSGAFLGLAYFDLYYHVVAILVLCRVLVEKELAAPEKIQQESRVDPVGVRYLGNRGSARREHL